MLPSLSILGRSGPYPLSTFTRHNAFRVHVLPLRRMAWLTPRRHRMTRRVVPPGAPRGRMDGVGLPSTASEHRHFDLAVIGTGSGNSIIDEQFADRRVALLEDGIFGGTCLNVGCIPTKMFISPADLAYEAAHGGRLGLETRFRRARWPEIRGRIFGRIDPISIGGRHWRADKNENVTLFEDHARFVDVRTLDTGTGQTITADQVVIAAGSRPILPEVEGLLDIDFHTSNTIMRIDDLPDRLLILG